VPSPKFQIYLVRIPEPGAEVLLNVIVWEAQVGAEVVKSAVGAALITTGFVVVPETHPTADVVLKLTT
jgi:hypothetical protein